MFSAKLKLQYFFKIPLAKKIIKILPNIFGRKLEGRDRATPIFGQKLKLFKKLIKSGYFFKIPFV